jgi:two-component system chemotaxis response regulator CheB
MTDPDTPPVGDGPRREASGTRYTCPDCGGVLFEQVEDGLTRYRCSVGHVFSIESLAAEQARQLEGALWTAVRALEDRAELLRQMASSAKSAHRSHSTRTFERQAADLLRRSQIIRDAIERTRVAGDEHAEEAVS